MEKWLNLDELLIPEYIQILYWVLLVVSILLGLSSMMHIDFLTGLAKLVVGVVISRVACELIVLLFNINDSLEVLADRQYEDEAETKE